MDEVTLRGTHFEIGRQVGRQLREAGTELPALDKRQTRYIDTLVEQVEGQIPNLFDEMRGLAEAGEFDAKAVYFYCRSGVKSCSLMLDCG